MTEEILLGLRDFLQPYLPLLNTHNVDYLVRDHWNSFIPEWMRRTEQINLYDALEERYQTEKPVTSPLDDLLKQIVYWRRRIEQITYTRERFEEEIGLEKDRPSFKFRMRTFMSEKKEHEVDILAPVIDQIARLSQSDSIIDYGSGRGYLGVQLSQDYHRYILGIESCEMTVHSGEQRMKLLFKHHKELADDLRYRTTSTIVDSQTDFEKLFHQTFQSHSSSFLLCGLHSCGGLSSSLLYHFVQKSSVHSIANVACCYHLLEEKYSPNPFTGRCSEDDPASFPLSRRLIDEKMKLGRNARMLAVQSLERNRADQTLNAGLWYRALMQVILIEVYQLTSKLEEIKLGKITKKSFTFEDYVWKALEKLKLDKSRITSTMIDEYWQRYESQQLQLHTFVQLKVLFSGLVEMIILLDRLRFLEESLPNASSYLVALFDPIKSPRRWCLISFKRPSS